MPIYIYAARFQPFHNDHLKVVEWFMDKYPDEYLLLAIVTGIREMAKAENIVQIKSIEHLEPGRNPFTPTEVLSMIGSLTYNRYPARVIATLVPPPSQTFGRQIINGLFPGNKVWIVPERGEEWDELKTNSYLSMGDEVLRFKCIRSTSGHLLREYLNNGDYDSLKSYLPSEIWYIMQNILKKRNTTHKELNLSGSDLRI